MVIAVNTRALLTDKLEGYGYYIDEIFSRIAKNHPEHDFYFFSTGRLTKGLFMLRIFILLLLNHKQDFRLRGQFGTTGCCQFI